MTSSNGTFSALLAICAGTVEFPAQRPVTRSFDFYFDLRLNKRLSKQSWGCWFETLPRPLWRHCNDFNSLRPRLYIGHFADDIFECIFLNENIWNSIKFSLKFVPINSIPALVRVMVWCLPGDKPSSEPMMVTLLTHIYVTWPQWCKGKIRRRLVEYILQ